MVRTAIQLPLDKITAICRRYPVRELAVFGSVLRDDFRPNSDVDLLVDLKPNHGMGLIEYLHLQGEFEDVIGRSVDLVQKSGLKRFVRDEILNSAQVLYAE